MPNELGNYSSKASSRMMLSMTILS